MVRMPLDMERASVASKRAGFLQFFDWNRKSRRKLFSSGNDTLEGGTKIDGIDDELASSNFHKLVSNSHGDNGVEVDESRPSDVRETSDCCCTSSVNEGEPNGILTPSIVARLMGLQSMPSPGTSGPFCMPSIESRLRKDTHSHLEIFPGDQSMDVKELIDECSRNPLELKSQNLPSSPVERFQREVPPSRLVKSLPAKQHTILSNDATRIMKAASVRILKPALQVDSNVNVLRESSSPTSTNLHDSQESNANFRKVRWLQEWSTKQTESSDLNKTFDSSKECSSTSKKASSHSIALKNQAKSSASGLLSGEQSSNKWNGFGRGIGNGSSLNMDGEHSLQSWTKGKSISLAIQAKINVQRRERLLASCGAHDAENLQEDPGRLKARTLKSQVGCTKDQVKKKKDPSSNSGVLKQNNLKQNYLAKNDQLPFKHTIPEYRRRQMVSGKPSSLARCNPSSHGKPKCGHKRVGKQEVKEKETPSKGSVKEEQLKGLHRQSYKSETANESFVSGNRKQISHVIYDEQFKKIDGINRIGDNIVSFTFSSPVMAQSKLQSMNKKVDSVDNDSYIMNDSAVHLEEKKSSFHDLESVKDDALSILLDQKLHELSMGLGLRLSESDQTDDFSSTASMSEHWQHVFNDESVYAGHEDECRLTSIENNDADFDSSEFSSIDIAQSSLACNDSSNATCTEYDRHPISIQDVSSRSERSINGTNGTQKMQAIEMQMEIPNSTHAIKQTETKEYRHETKGTTIMISNKQEVEYVKKILSTVNIHLKNFDMNSMCWTLDPHLFYLLEFNKKPSLASERKVGKLRRKVLFDCVSECFDAKHACYFSAGYQSWTEGIAAVRWGRFSEEICKEIFGWEAMSDWMVDELVDREMSCKLGRWIDFEIDAYETGVEIQDEILERLVDEVITELLPSTYQ